MKKEIKDMGKSLEIPEESISNVLKDSEELSSFPTGDIATFNELINASVGTEFITVSIKDVDSIRDVFQGAPIDVRTKKGTCGRTIFLDNDDFETERVPVTWVSWLFDKGGIEIPFTDIDAKMENVGKYTGRWTYTIYKIKK